MSLVIDSPCSYSLLTYSVMSFVLLKKAFLSFYWIFGLLILGCLDIWNFHFFLSILYLYEIFKVLSNLHYLAKIQWRRRDSNSWPPACKAGALPTELHPHLDFYSIQRLSPMGLSGLEPPTSRLSGVRSNQLSYKPIEIFRSLWCFQLSLDNWTV